jgi:DNA-binding response OmpR family regulator
MAIEGHVLLVGRGLCQNWALVQRLARRGELTLARRSASVAQRLLAAADVVAVGGRDCGATGLCRLVRRLRGMTSVPIVVLDGDLRAPDVVTVLGCGARDYFPEPLNVPIIAERLEHLAGRTRASRELSDGR